MSANVYRPTALLCVLAALINLIWWDRWTHPPAEMTSVRVCVCVCVCGRAQTAIPRTRLCTSGRLRVTRYGSTRTSRWPSLTWRTSSTDAVAPATITVVTRPYRLCPHSSSQIVRTDRVRAFGSSWSLCEHRPYHNEYHPRGKFWYIRLNEIATDAV